MGHLAQRHVGKTPDELIHRLYKEWKDCTGTLTSDISDELMTRIDTLKLQDGRTVVELDMERIVGFGYSRQLERFVSSWVRCVICKDGDNVDLVTAYPIPEKGELTGEIFNLHMANLNTALEPSELPYNFNGYAWKLLCSLVEQGYTCRYVHGKNPQVRVYTEMFTFKFTSSYVEILDNAIRVAKIDIQMNEKSAIHLITTVLTCPNILGKTIPVTFW